MFDGSGLGRRLNMSTWRGLPSSCKTKHGTSSAYRVIQVTLSVLTNSASFVYLHQKQGSYGLSPSAAGRKRSFHQCRCQAVDSDDDSIHVCGSYTQESGAYNTSIGSSRAPDVRSTVTLRGLNVAQSEASITGAALLASGKGEI